MDEYTFNQLERTYQTFRYSLDPTTNQVVGDKQAAQKNDNKLLSDLSKSNFRKTMQLKRQGFGNPGETDYKGPWAGYDNEFTYDTQNAPTSKEIQESEETRLTSLFLKGGDAVVKEGEKSVFHGGRERVDYQGRNFLHCPDNVELGDSGNQVCYLPKKCLHTWSGHTKGNILNSIS